MTTIINALTARSMISRAAADGDRRGFELTVTDAGQQAVHAWQATNAAVLHLALSALPEPQQRALAAAVPAIDALATAIDRLADTRRPARNPDKQPGTPAASNAPAAAISVLVCDSRRSHRQSGHQATATSDRQP